MECEIRKSLVVLALAMLMAGCGRPRGDAQFRAGLKALSRGRTEQSIQAFQSALAHSADSNLTPIALNYLGVAYYRAGQADKALASFEASRKLAPLLPDPVYNTAVLMVEQNQDSRAISLFEKAGLMDLKDSRPYEYLAMLYCRREQWPEARRVLNEADKRAPQSPRILTAMAVLELQTNGVKKAEELLAEALKHDRRFAPAIFNAAVLNHLWLKDNDKAAAYYRDFIRLSADNTLSDRARQALLDLKQAGRNKQNAAPAGTAPAMPVIPPPEWKENELVRAGRPAPDALDYRGLIAAAKAQLSAGQPNEALRNFLLAESAAANDDKTDDARTALKMAARACPDTAAERYALARRMYERRLTGDALAQLKLAVAHSNTWSEARLLLAEVAIQEHEYDVALESLNALTRQPRDNADAQWLKANLYDRQLRQPKDALESFKQFCRKFPSDPRSEGARQRIAALSAATAGKDSPAADAAPAGPTAVRAAADSNVPPSASTAEPAKPAVRKRQFISPRRIIGERR